MKQKFKSKEAKQAYLEQTESWLALTAKWEAVPKLSHSSKKSVMLCSVPLREYRQNDIKSLPDSVKGAVSLKRSVMDPRSLANESPEVVAATLNKSKSIMPLYNKGADMYCPDVRNSLLNYGPKTRRS